MREGWEERSLEEFFKVGSSKRVKKSDWRDEGVPFFRAREIVRLNRSGDAKNELFISEEMFSEYAEKYGVPEPGDLMVTGVGTLGVTHIVKPKDRFYFKDASVLWLKKEKNISSEYVNYAFHSDLIRRQVYGTEGATVGTLTISRARKLRLPVPPLAEQRRIVAILDEAFEGIAAAKANAEKNLENSREVFEAEMAKVFDVNESWKSCLIEDVINFIDYRGKTPKKNRFWSTVDHCKKRQDGMP